MHAQATSHGGHPISSVSCLGRDDGFGEAKPGGLRESPLGAGNPSQLASQSHFADGHHALSDVDIPLS